MQEHLSIPQSRLSLCSWGKDILGEQRGPQQRICPVIWLLLETKCQEERPGKWVLTGRGMVVQGTPPLSDEKGPIFQDWSSALTRNPGLTSLWTSIVLILRYIANDSLTTPQPCPTGQKIVRRAPMSTNSRPGMEGRKKLTSLGPHPGGKTLSSQLCPCTQAGVGFPKRGLIRKYLGAMDGTSKLSSEQRGLS